jgi:hypothetical protein
MISTTIIAPTQYIWDNAFEGLDDKISFVIYLVSKGRTNAITATITEHNTTEINKPKYGL